MVQVQGGKNIPVDPVECGEKNVELHHVRGNQYVLHAEGRTRLLVIDAAERKKVSISSNNQAFVATVLDHRDQLLAEWGLDEKKGQNELDVLSPMPGLVLSVAVIEGQKVSPGTPLLVLEAMKMENEIKAVSDQVISKINVRPGDAVQKGHVMIEFSPAES